jgi:hypothetical protein
VDNEIDLQKELNKPVSELTRKFYNDILNAMDARAANAKKSLDEIQTMMVEIAGIVDSEWMYQQRVTKMRDLRDLKLSELIPVVKRAAISAHSEKLKIMASQVDTSTLQAENARLSAELAKASRERDFYREASVRSDEEAQELKKKLADLLSKGTREIDRQDRVIAQTMISGEHDEGFEAVMKSKFSDRLQFLIRAVGERGEILSPDLGRAIEDQYALRPRSSPVYDIITEAEALWLITLRDTDIRQPGVKPKMVTLTKLGVFAYEKLFSTPPRKVDHATEHKTQAHAALIMQAEELLRKVGYEILDSFEIRQGQLHTFQPDITAKKNGHTIYVEVEREGTKARQDTETKWRNFRNFSNGEMYIFCENTKVAQETLRILTSSHIGYAGDTAHICNMAKTTKSPKDEKEIWTKTIKS